MGFPAEKKKTSVEIRHMHARHEEIRRDSWGPSRRPLHMCRQTSTQFGQI